MTTKTRNHRHTSCLLPKPRVSRTPSIPYQADFKLNKWVNCLAMR